MKVYALVGKSGTGKSFRAINLCRHMNIEYIIDDGLFIGGNAILAGTSAKRKGTILGAIKTAIFTDEEHRRQVCEKIKEVSPDAILIIGTSDEMVEKISRRLELPEISRTIRIEDITTEEERKTAAKQRNEQGKHVIPVPTPQLKKEFSGYFLDPLSLFKSKPGSKGNPGRTVVRPSYSYLGEYSISDRVIYDIIDHVAENSKGIYKVIKKSTYKSGEGISITASIIMREISDIIKHAERFQDDIAKEVERITAFNIEEVNIEIRGIKCN